MTSNSGVRVLIVDDHQVVRAGLRTILSLNDGLEIIGEAGDGQSAIEECIALEPDVVLMDMKMPGMDGPTAIEHITAQVPEVNIIALTSFDDPSLVRRALEAGAIGYLLKDTDEDELVAAIRLAGEGRGVVAPSAMRAIVGKPTAGDGEDYRVVITDREMDVLRLVARGLTNAQISARLDISVSTVNFHVHNILEKLGAKTRTEAVAIAAREGLIDI